MLCNRFIGLSGLVESELGLLGLNLLLSNLFTELLGRIQNIDSIFIVKDVPTGLLEHLKNRSLCVTHLSLVFVLSHYQSLVLFVQLHVFFAHDQVE